MSKEPKNIVVLADGTGNGASALSKTNVWRLYRAVDLSEPAEPNDRLQIAFYIDGVGTSAFRPLALLGSVFGIGVARNAKEIYKFICRNFEPGDRIFAFGFSRGAFTARVVASLITTQGVLQYTTEEDLERATGDAYRAYRRRYKLPIFGRKDTTKAAEAQKRVGLVDLVRDGRDLVRTAWRKLRGIPQSSTLPPHEPDVAFLGVWDTVSAYGLPIEELTRGIDNWVWPLSMPNYRLSEKVRCARHALALDEERDSFQPLLWDEEQERKLEEAGKVAPGRLQQVWFAGVHSNVGGGYADDTLALVPLEWMMNEAGKVGLRYVPLPRQEPRPPANPFGRRYDSRAGIGAYYRYQPRKLSARLMVPDPTTRLQQNPSRRDRGFLRRALVHQSVLDRIRSGTDHYAPIGLPAEFDVLGPDGRESTIRQPERAARQEWVWNDVWRRRVNYFLILGLSFLLAVLPLIQSYWPPSACLGPQCILSPLLTGAGMFLPGLLKPWLEAFARTPGTAAGLLSVLMLLLGRSGFLERRIRDAMRELWLQSLGIPLPSGSPRTWAGQNARGAWGFVHWLRTSRAYQRTFQYLKWWIGPAAFGMTLLVGGLLVCVALLLIIVGRLDLVRKEADGSICELGANQAAAAPGQFSTKQLCWRLGQRVQKGLRYRIHIRVAQRWRDQDVGTDPQGFGNDRMPAPAKFGAYLVRRSAADKWFQPVLRITRVRGEQSRLQPLEFRCRCGGGLSSTGDVTYTAEFTAEQEGEVSLFINDAVIAVPGFSKVPFGVTPEFYENNEGTATVEISPVDDSP